MADHIQEDLRARLTARAREALAHFAASDPVLINYRENAVFQISLPDGGCAALRLHRPGYHQEAALRSELDWLAALHDAGLAVPRPLPAREGQRLVRLPLNDVFPEHFADMVSWMEGIPLGRSGVPLAHPPAEQARLFHAIGAAMASLHEAADRWRPPDHFVRPRWNAEGLVGDRPLWGRFWDCEGLRRAEAERLAALRDRLAEGLRDAASAGLDYGLIHADLVRENVLITRAGIGFIDFDDGGYGYRLFDIATALLKNRNEPAYADIEAALIGGYRSRRPLDEDALARLPLFLVLRSLTYIGWLAARPESADAGPRMQRYVAESLALAEAL